MTPITYGYRPKIILTYPRNNDPKPPMTSEAIDLIWTERERQLAKGYDAAHDDARPAGALVDAALCHAITRNGKNIGTAKKLWPYAQKFKPAATPKESVLLAASLLLAELERMLRAE